jgi:hypothetical protein
MEEETRGERARGTSERVYAGVLRASAAIVVLTIFGGLAYLVSIDQIDGGALLLYAGVLLGYILIRSVATFYRSARPRRRSIRTLLATDLINAAWRRR